MVHIDVKDAVNYQLEHELTDQNTMRYYVRTVSINQFPLHWKKSFLNVYQKKALLCVSQVIIIYKISKKVARYIAE